MEAILNRTHSAVGGFVISLALVFGGSTSFAEGLTGFGAGDSRALLGDFSDADVQALEHANTAEATAARLAALGVAEKGVTPMRPRSTSRDAEPVVASDDEVFQHSERLFSLLVPRPRGVDSDVATAGVKLRPGLVQPVGVSPATLRSPTPSERMGK